MSKWEYGEGCGTGGGGDLGLDLLSLTCGPEDLKDEVGSEVKHRAKDFLTPYT